MRNCKSFKRPPHIPHIRKSNNQPQQASCFSQLLVIRSVTYEFEVIDVRDGAFGSRFPSNFNTVVFVIDNFVILQQLKFEVCRALYQFDIECRRLVSPPPIPPMLIVKRPGHRQLLHSNVDQGRSNGLAFGGEIRQTLFLDSKALAHLQLGATGPVSSVLLPGTPISTRSHPVPHQSSHVIHKSLVWLTVVPPPASQTMTTSPRCENRVSAS